MSTDDHPSDLHYTYAFTLLKIMAYLTFPFSFCLALAFFLVRIRFIYPDHFFGGTITWQIENIAHNSSWVPVRLTQIYSWKYSRAGCATNTSMTANQSISVSSGLLSCKPFCPTNFGPVSTLVMCKEASLLENYAVGQRSDVIWTPVNSSFSVIYNGSAWGSFSLGGGGGAWSVLSYINLVRRSDTGSFNNAPTVTFVSPVYLYVYEQRSIKLSVYDADGDDVRCRWALSNNTNQEDECGSACMNVTVPADIILHSDCTVEMKTINSNGTYVFAVMVEDFVSVSSLVPLSSVPAQFIAHVIYLPRPLVNIERKISAPLLTSLIATGVFLSLLCGFCLCRYFQIYAVFGRRRQRRREISHMHIDRTDTDLPSNSWCDPNQSSNSSSQRKTDQKMMTPVLLISTKNSTDEGINAANSNDDRLEKANRKLSSFSHHQQDHTASKSLSRRKIKRNIRVQRLTRESVKKRSHTVSTKRIKPFNYHQDSNID